MLILMDRKNKSRVGAVVLAAGSSSRMGKPKQLLPLAGATVLAQTLQNLRAAQVDQIVLVLGSSAEIIEQHFSNSLIDGLKIVINPDFREGMASSLRTGLVGVAYDIEAVLIVLADQPFVQPGTLKQIIECYRESVAEIVIPIYKGFRGNPVLLDRSLFAEVMALKGDIGCRAIFGNHTGGIVKLDVKDIGILLDLDNQEDYERLRDFDHQTSDDRFLLGTVTRAPY